MTDVIGFKFFLLLAKKSLMQFATSSTGSSTVLPLSCRVIQLLVDFVTATLSSLITCQQAFDLFYALTMQAAVCYFGRFLSLRSSAFFISAV